MSEIQLRGYNVDFPYPVPYEIQKAYMNNVLECLDNKTHAVLESPTGTGKTLCLFAPVAAWAKRKKLQYVSHSTPESNMEINSQYFNDREQLGPWGAKTKSKIWYTSRTHSQIAQTVSEVRKCNIEGLHVRVMGARDQLCINELVLEEKDSYVKTIKCKELVKGKSCKYYTKLTYEKDIRRFYQSGEVLDIEDLVSVGKACGVCPYFLAKKASEEADIVLLPYNYIIDRESRESNGFYLQNDVIIFDEGHNVPSTCEESYEFSFTSLDIALGIRNMQEFMLSLTKLTEDLIQDEEIDIAQHASNSMMMMEILQKLEQSLSLLPVKNELLPVSELYNFFTSAGITEFKSRKLIDGIASFKSDSAKLSLTGSTLETFNLLEKMMNTIFGSAVKSFPKSVVEKSFKCGVTIDPDRHNVKKFSLFCFNPSFGIKSLLMLGVQSIIITSGTLSPLKTFICELGLPNPVTLENKHIAEKCQVPFVILGTGVNNIRMDGAYKNRNDAKYVFSLGMSLTNLIASVPDGVLLLFSSYTMMQKLKESWESDLGIWTRLNNLKRVFMEPRNKNEFINCMENYKRSIDAGNGAILMGVLRGKISEGMDFKDQYCRGVFIIGVPFPPVQDPRVIGKQKYAESLTVLNPVSKLEEKLYNQTFMSVEAMRATNQAIGRVIRHGKDYGVIILVDYRFAWPSLFHNISSWLRGDAPVESNFPTTKKLVTNFFRNVHQGRVGVEEIRSQQVDANGYPVTSTVAFEEYDHKKQSQVKRLWIGPDTLSSTPSTKTTAINHRDNRRGHSSIEYVDDNNHDNDFNPKQLLSLYKTSSLKTHRNDSTGAQKSDCLLDALEKSRNSSVGYRESNENNKRKHENMDEEEFSSRNNRSNPSPSLFSPPESSSQSSQPKKFAHLKVKQLLPASENDRDIYEDEPTTKPPEIPANPRSNKNAEDVLKSKLMDYYKTAKSILSKEDDQRFRTTSCRYMKGEITLFEVIKLMDDVFMKADNKNLFRGFGICVKSKDKSEWLTACRERKI